MVKLQWDAAGEKRYETGVDRGVLYLPDGSGYAWNGLVRVEEAPEGGETTSLHIDGVSYLNVRTGTNFAATMEAFTYPDEFLPFDGVVEVSQGFYITDQPVRELFGLSWRTLVGDDVSGLGGYKLHLAYGLTAQAATKDYETMSENSDASTFAWGIKGLPQHIDGYKAMAHVILESRKIPKSLMGQIESILYGDEWTDPRMPDISEIKTLIDNGPLVIWVTDNGDGTWTATSNVPGQIEMLDETTFQITADTAVFVDTDTYEISSTN